MEADIQSLIPFVVGFVALAGLVGAGVYLARQRLNRARRLAAELLAEAEQDAANRTKEILLAAHEKSLSFQEEADRRERELHEREVGVEERARAVERESSQLARDRKQLERLIEQNQRQEGQTREALEAATAKHEEARLQLERVAGLNAEQAHAELVASVEQQARRQATRMAKKISDEARETAERDALDLMVRASQRVNIREALESTVSFIELPTDEMKGRIIGREGRNIRALEMATGVDLIVDDTPRSILISSFDPIRRETARVAIERLVVDGRIHPARIEEVVAKVREEIDGLIDEKGTEAAYALGISDMHPKLARLIGKMRYHTARGQNLLQHCIETASIAAHMAREVGCQVEVAQRSALLHEIGHTTEEGLTSHPTFAAAELAAKYGESDDVVHAIRSLHPDVEPRTTEAILLTTANRMSENRPGARKENLAVFIERLKRLESIAVGFEGVHSAFAVKSGKEIRVIVDAERISDQEAFKLCRKIARAVERDLSYPGQIKVNVIRETRAIRYAL